MHNACFSGVRQAMTLKCIVSIMCAAVMVFLGSAEELIRTARESSLLPTEYHKTFLESALHSDAFVSFLPVLAVLPFSGTYVDDLKSKFARFYLIRSDYRSYLFSRIFVCFLCGGSVIFLGGLLSWGASTLLFMPMERAAEAPSESTAILLKTYVLLFLNGGLWAVMGMAISTFMESKYIAYVSPFILYYLLVILYERYFPKWFLIYPREWMNPSDLWPLGFWGPATLMIELTFLCSLLFVFRAGRRLREL